MAAGYEFPEKREKVLVSLNDHYKKESLDIAKDFVDLGFTLIATTGTHKFLAQHGIESVEIEKFDINKIQDQMKNKELSFVLNTPTMNNNSYRKGSEGRGFMIRTIAELYSTPCFTSIDTARAFLKAFKYYIHNEKMEYKSIDKYRKSPLLGFISI